MTPKIYRVNLSQDEINLVLSCIGIVLNIVARDDKERAVLESLQTKLMAIRDAN